jgi:beta-aspartyl-peptidase (threonine type)
MSGWSLIIHGGAKAIVPDRRQANREGLQAAVAAGVAVLRAGGGALDAAEQTIRALEDLPVFNAGYGSVLNADGMVEMDAALMEGRELRIGAVGAIQGVRHPITVARALMGETPVLLVAEGARRFAAERGLELCAPQDMIAPGVMGSGGGLDTVGCVARDRDGVIVAGTSTGGLAGKRPGRVGDSPLPGCGLYAQSGVGGVSISGDGDKIARVLLAARVMQALGEGATPWNAARLGLAAMDQVGGEAGAIVLDDAGRLGCAHSSAHFAMGGATEHKPEPSAWLHEDEMREALHG